MLCDKSWLLFLKRYVPLTRALRSTAAPAHDLEHRDAESHHQDEVDQTSAKVADKTEQPENQENSKDRPEHLLSFRPLLVAAALVPSASYGVAGCAAG